MCEIIDYIINIGLPEKSKETNNKQTINCMSCVYVSFDVVVHVLCFALFRVVVIILHFWKRRRRRRRILMMRSVFFFIFSMIDSVGCAGFISGGFLFLSFRRIFYEVYSEDEKERIENEIGRRRLNQNVFLWVFLKKNK